MGGERIFSVVVNSDLMTFSCDKKTAGSKGHSGVSQRSKMAASWNCYRLLVLYTVTTTMIAAVCGESCTADDHRFYMELWEVQEDFSSLSSAVFSDGEPFLTGHTGTLSFNGNETEIWDPFKDRWPAEQAFDHFALQITSRVCSCQNMSLLLYLSSDDGSLLYVDGEVVIDMNQMQSVTGSTAEKAIELKAGVCKDLKIQYFEKQDNQFLNLGFYQIDPPPSKENLHRRALGGELIFLPESMVTCNVTECSGVEIPVSEVTPATEEEAPEDTEDEKIEVSETPNPPADDQDTKQGGLDLE